MSFSATSRPSYSLIELLVVIGVIVLIGISSIPGIFNRNDRLSLDTAANQIRQVIIDAETRSKAPDKADGANATQVYQVSFGNFKTGAYSGNQTVEGTISTTSVSMERGLAQCDSGDLQGGFTAVRNLNLPRGIYIASFYPTIQSLDDTKSVIRFTVGQQGFTCGSYSNPLIKSASIYQGAWAGVQFSNGESIISRYLVVTVASQKVAEQRFVTVDRETGEVSVSRSNPQSYFKPIEDKYAPRWVNVDANKFTLSVTCGSSNSSVVISFPRAQDRVSDGSEGDPNLLVTYDLSWDSGNGAQSIANGYFEDLSHDTVRYQFTTDRFTNANQPHQVTIKASAVDANGLAQPETDPDPKLAQRVRLFDLNSGLSCGSVISDPNTPQFDPGGASTACNPVTLNTPTRPRFWSQVANIFFARAEAKSPALICAGENPV